MALKDMRLSNILILLVKIKGCYLRLPDILAGYLWQIAD